MKFIRFIFILCFFIFELNIYSSQWFCKEGASKRIEDSYEVCGIGIDKDEDIARKNALKNAFEEFDLICNKSDECRGKYKEIIPLRVDCEKNDDNKYTCYRAINISIDRERIIDKNLNNTNNDNYETIIIETNKKEIEKNTTIKSKNKEKTRTKEYDMDKDIYKNYTNNIITFIDIKTRTPITGNVIRLHKNGKVKKIFVLKDGLINGFLRNYNENGKIKSEFLYKHGVPYGTSTYWNENGKIILVGIILHNQGFVDIKIEGFHENKNIKDSTNLINIPLNEWYKLEFTETNESFGKYFSGEHKSYHENGKIKFIRNFINGKVEGRVISYYNTGELEAEYFYKNSILHGEYKKYSIKKFLTETGYFCNGIRCGAFQLFYDTGELNSEYQYINGKKEGKGTFYLKDSNICAIFIYNNDILVSAQTSLGREYNRAELVNCKNTLKCPCY